VTASAVDGRFAVTDPAEQAVPIGRHLLAFRAFFATVFFSGVAMLKSSSFLPALMAVVSHRGFNPRPAQVSEGFSGLRYFGATLPRTPLLWVAAAPDPARRCKGDQLYPSGNPQMVIEVVEPPRLRGQRGTGVDGSAPKVIDSQ
jgi:hypothetical protein